MRRRVSSVIVLLFVGTTATQAFAKTQRPEQEDTEEPAEEEEAPSKSPSNPLVTKAPPPPPAPADKSPGVGLPPAAEPVRLETPSGTTIRFGILAQPQFEAASSRALDITGRGYNIFLHRLRFMVGGTLLHKFEYFISTDYPDLFKQVHTIDATDSPVYLKNFPGLNLQDAFVTYKPSEYFKIDAGYMLPPMSHNAVQGAATLYGLDYFANTFLHKDAFGTSSSRNLFNPNTNPLGRDLGVQFRGLLFRGLLEYRAGIFQGLRLPPGGISPDMPTAPGGRNMFRIAGRIQINLLDPETGFFYSGSYLGTKRILSLGASGDLQNEYKYWAYDALLDLPLGPGVITAQVNLAQWSPGTWLPAVYLLKQRALMAEAGYLIAPIRLSPMVRVEQLWVASTWSGGTQTGAAQTERRIGGGLAFWPYGHNVNLKVFYMRTAPTAPDTHKYDEFILQWQVYYF